MSEKHNLTINVTLISCVCIFQVDAAMAENNLEGLPPQGEGDEIQAEQIVEGKLFDPVMFRISSGISQYEDIYVTPLTWSEDFHGNETEIIYQLSAKVRLFDMNMYFAYTQKSFWQAFNNSDSSPFRETNYNPELFYRIPPGSKLLKNLGLDVGLEHDSNGGTLPSSRSWNRAYITPYYVRAYDLFYLKLWYRFPEDVKNSPLDSSGDDNPDIQHYLGYSEFHYMHQSHHMHHFQMMLRGNYNTAKGAVHVIYDIPSGSKDMYYQLSLWSGYGETLIDYNRSITRVGIGVSFYR